MPKTIKKGQFLVVEGRSEFGLTPFGRTMRSPLDQIVGFKHPNQFFDLRLEHIAGPLKGTTIIFTHTIARQAKLREVCTCSGYSYPHRKGTTKCEANPKKSKS